MSALAQTAADAGALDERWLDWLLVAVRRNRFIPEPDPASIFVGDGDFRAIGAEFLGHLVRIGGLQPHHRVLDIGSGIGRLAAPMTQYLDGDATYLGLDPTREGIAWCQSAITRAYPNFRFRHIDVAHSLYNPGGLLRGDTLVLPVGDRSIDMALMVSVVTHLPPNEVTTYCREMARVLAPGGTAFITFFSIDRAGPPPTVVDPRARFARLGDSVAWSASATDPLGMIAFDAGWLEAQLGAVGLTCGPLHPGSWRGVPSTHYQDIVVATKAGGGR